MGFRYRKSIDGDAVQPVKDYPLDPAYASAAKPEDVVRLNASGQLVKAGTGDTEVLGVLEGVNFEGMCKPPKVGKVRISPNALYEADYVGTGPLTVGAEYGIDDNGNLDTDNTTTKIAKIVEVVNGKPHVVITARQMV